MSSDDAKEPKRRFPAPWRVEKSSDECFSVRDAKGFCLAWVYCRDDLQKWSFGHGHLTSDEARRIATAIARLSEFLMQRQGFYSRGSGQGRWRPDRPFHVALEDTYLRAHWFDIDTLCKLNSIPFNATGETIESGGVWRVYEFALQMDAIRFWSHFEGRWLLGNEFHYPERPQDLPPMKEPKGSSPSDSKKSRS